MWRAILFHLVQIQAIQTLLEAPTYFEECLSNIANRHFVDKTTIIVDSELLFQFNYPKIDVDSTNLHILQGEHEDVPAKANGFILSYYNLTQLDQIMYDLKGLSVWNSRAKYLVVSRIGIQSEEVEEIINLLWNHDIYQILVASNNSNCVELFSYDFFKSGCGQNMTAELVARCENGIIDNSKLYPERSMSDMCNTTLNAIWSYTSPYVIDYKLEKNPGILVTFMRVFAEKTNIHVQYCEDGSIYAREVENSKNTVYDTLNNRTADIFVYLTGHEYDMCNSKIDCTHSISQEYVYWIIPKPKKKAFWKSIFATFTNETWLYYAITLLVAVFTFWLIGSLPINNTKAFGLTRSITLVVQITLGTGGRVFFKCASFRIFFLVLCLSNIIIMTGYCGKLFTFLSHPGYEKSVTTLDEILESPMMISFAEAMSVIFLFSGSKNQMVFDRYVPLLDARVDYILDKWNLHRNYITLTNGGDIILHAPMKKAFNTLEAFSFQIIYSLRRDHILLDRLNDMILRITQAGLYGKWICDMETGYNKLIVTEDENKASKLTKEHLEGAFILLGFGYLLATVAFIMEQFKRCKK